MKRATKSSLDSWSDLKRDAETRPDGARRDGRDTFADRERQAGGLDPDVIEYFKAMSAEKGVPYPTLINLYLQDCAARHRELKMIWSA